MLSSAPSAGRDSKTFDWLSVQNKHKLRDLFAGDGVRVFQGEFPPSCFSRTVFFCGGLIVEISVEVKKKEQSDFSCQFTTESLRCSVNICHLVCECVCVCLCVRVRVCARAGAHVFLISQHDESNNNKQTANI